MNKDKNTEENQIEACSVNYNHRQPACNMGENCIHKEPVNIEEAKDKFNRDHCHNFYNKYCMIDKCICKQIYKSQKDTH